MTDKELKQLVESNARTAQAMLDSMAESRLEREELREGMVRLQEGMVRLDNTMVRLTEVQEGMTKILAALDEDRPTVFKKLTSIENKIDRLWQESERDDK